MNTATAASQASVTVATIRTWCRIGAVAATKVAGRWIVEAASLARRIALGKKPSMVTPISRAEFEQAAAKLGIRHPFKDARCHAEYRAFKANGGDSATAYDRLMVARGAALDAEGFTAPQRSASTAGTGLVHREMQALTGLGSSGAPGECHYCGLNANTCDCR